MSKRILVIGGTRFFGRLLVERLLAQGHRVTLATRGRARDPFEDRVGRIVVDRRDRDAMVAAFSSGDRYDLVYDQVCYSPRDAAIAVEVFRGRVARYVMSSTIEVYDALYGQQLTPFAEGDVKLDREPIERDAAWEDPALAEQRYGAWKRQAEAVLHGDESLPVVSVRIGHVLAGPEDFTGRLAHYVRGVLEGKPLRHSANAAASSFISAAGIADFLGWVGEGTFVGPLNAASDGPLSAIDLHGTISRSVGRDVPLEATAGPERPTVLSPFDFAYPYVMDTGRARSLGYRFDHTAHWLDALIAPHARALAA